MKSSVRALFRCAMILTMALVFVVPCQGLAGDNGKGGKPPKKEKHYSDKAKKDKGKDSKSDVTVNVYFTDKHRNVIRNYYREEYRSGHCPPGLAKKNNGCMPPGQAKKWRLGYPVPHDVVVYDLPTTIIRQLGPPPAGHRYVRVASDILMIAVGTGLIVDAVQDLNDL
ncbi:RcnB family protein [Desulfopila aestuarii]|uniref:Nickel/cobalt transporter regulator n=1 Tax=Desulfopila aestuarii DSM 18488 TaxID=1121416 RepID=A0A1M7YH70_9BACT|nr:RcnB family protein [Desulfopila aestuarii]SHO51943.1 Nickel/cobalt transporter regulator [Desulfopila aestuarii DSM 18488]